MSTPEPITGIPRVDGFLAGVPDAWDPDNEMEPLTFGFRDCEEGMDVVQVQALSPGAERDDAMNGHANFVIAYAKTARPVAIVTVSETFRQTVESGGKPLPPVDCDRFTADPAYRAEILKTRTECLAAWAETAGGTVMVRWPICREGGTRRLGERQVDREQHRGRLMNLLRKEHAADEIVETAKPSSPAFAPEPIEALRARFPAAAAFDLTTADDVGRPELRFDYADADGRRLRLVLSAFHGDLSATALNLGPGRPLSAVRADLFHALTEISGRRWAEADVINRVTHSGLGLVSLRLRDIPRAATREEPQ